MVLKSCLYSGLDAFMMHFEGSISYLDILRHEHAQMEIAKASMVAHVLRSTDTTHSIRKVTLLILTIDELKHY